MGQIDPDTDENDQASRKPSKVTVINAKTPGYDELIIPVAFGSNKRVTSAHKSNVLDADKDETDLNEDSQTDFFKTRPNHKLHQAGEKKDNERKLLTDSRKGRKLKDTQFSKIHQHFENVKFEVDLGQLYEIYDSCNYNSENQYCPVLLKLGKMMQADPTRTDYLLQVWSKQGKLIFERQLDKPLEAWNIQGNQFVFKERDQKMTYFYLHINTESQWPPTCLYQIEIQQKNAAFFSQKSKRSKAEDHSNDRVPLVDRVSLQIGLYCDYLLVKGTNCVQFTDLGLVRKSAQDHGNSGGLLKQHSVSLQNIHEFQYQSGCDLQAIVDLGEQNGEVESQTNNSESQKTAIVFENQEHNLVYYRIIKLNDEGAVDLMLLGLNTPSLGNNEQKQKQIKAQEKQLKLRRSDIDQVCFVVSKSPVDQLWSYSTLVQRQDGSFDFLSDFNLVQHVDEEDLRCFDIETDNQNFFLHMHVTDEWDSLFKQVITVPIKWKSEMGTKVAEKGKLDFIRGLLNVQKNVVAFVEEVGNFDQTRIHHQHPVLVTAVHKRISPYFKMYQFLNFKTYMIVAHRKYVSVFDLNSAKWFEQKFTFGENVVLIAVNERGRKPQDDLLLWHSENCEKILDFDSSKNIKRLFNVVVLLGNNEIQYIQEEKMKEDDFPFGLRSKFKNGNARKIPQRVVGFCVDQINNSAVYFLTERSASSENISSFIQVDNKNLFGVNQKPFQTSKKVQALRRKELYQLDIPESFDILGAPDCQITFFNVLKDQDQMVPKITISTQELSRSFNLAIDKRKIQVQSLSILDSSVADKMLMQSRELLHWRENKKSESEDEKFIGILEADSNDESQQGCFARITTFGIYVHDRLGKFVRLLKNPFIKDILLVDGALLYCICEDREETIKDIAYDEEIERTVESLVIGAQLVRQDSGIFVYDIGRIFNDVTIESYHIDNTISGQASHISFSGFNQRLSYLRNFSQIVMLPLPHRNTIELFGIERKSDYFIWREKLGFFTAINKRTFLIQTWSLSSGKCIWSKQMSSSLREILMDYEVYQANDSDSTYIKNFQNRAHESIQILKKKSPQSHLSASFKKAPDHTFQANRGHTLIQKEAIETQIFNFIVLSLSTFEDKPKKQNRLQILFQFEFPLPKDTKKYPCLHISKNQKKLLEVHQNQSALIYIREDFNEKENKGCFKSKQTSKKQFIDNIKIGPKIVWIEKLNLKKYPSLLQGKCQLPFLFDSNFERYLDVDYARGELVIRKVDTRHAGDIFIPKGLLNLEHEFTLFQSKFSTKNQISVQQIARRLHFVSTKLIRFINNEGVDVLIDFEMMAIVSYCKIDNFTEQFYNDPEHLHLYLEPKPLALDHVFDRLVVRSSFIKSEQALSQFKWKRSQFKKDKKYRRGYNLLLDSLYKIDYSQPWGEEGSKFVVELSFTVLDWKIIHQSVTYQTFDIDVIDTLQQIQLCFNILPQNQTFLHKIAEAGNSADNTIENVDELMENVFLVCKKGLKNESEAGYFRSKLPFEIPILQDMLGKTPVDEALGLGDLQSSESIFYRDDRIFEKMKGWRLYRCCGRGMIALFTKILEWALSRIVRELALDQGAQNVQLAGILFANLKNYKYLHSGPQLAASVSKAIKLNVADIGSFLDGRIIKSKLQPFVTQKAIKNSNFFMKQQTAYIGGQQVDGKDEDAGKAWVQQNYGVIQAQVWCDEANIIGQMFEDDGVEKPMIMRYFDIPGLESNSVEGQNFIRALHQVPTALVDEIFKFRSIQMLVNVHYDRSFWFIQLTMAIPYAALVGIFTFWSNFVVGDKGTVYDNANIPVQTAMIALSSWFLLHELYKMSRSLRDYFTDPNSFAYCLPQILLIFNILTSGYPNQSNQKVYTSKFWRIQAFTSLSLWYKILYFMRAYSKTSHFVRMLTEVLKATGPFLFILTLMVFGFADAGYSLSSSIGLLDPNKAFIESYPGALEWSFMNLVGGTDMSNYDGWVWWLFVFMTMIMVVIMLNFLISIITKRYGVITESKNQFMYSERVRLICDVQFFSYILKMISQASNLLGRLLHTIFCSCKCCHGKKNEYKMMNQRTGSDSCSLLFFAWEDPSIEAPTDDTQEKENEETTKLNEMANQVKKLNEKMAISKNDYPEQAITNGLNSIIEITQRETEALKKRQVLALTAVALKKKKDLDEEDECFQAELLKIKDEKKAEAKPRQDGRPVRRNSHQCEEEESHGKTAAKH